MKFSKQLILAACICAAIMLLSACPRQDTDIQVKQSTYRFPIPAKGICYEAFGPGYNPSTANLSAIYFGSDIARSQTEALWGNQTLLTNGTNDMCRNDLLTIQNILEANLVRLYDWDPRNDHSQFLNYCNALGLKAVVPISNWLATQNATVWQAQLPNYFSSKNFGNANGTNWHPAIAGVVITNEPLINNVNYDNVIALVGAFLKMAKQKGFSQDVLVGVPVAFTKAGPPYGPQQTLMPCWNQFDRLLNNPQTKPFKNQLMLCANTYNGADYLYKNAEATQQGWVPLTYNQFNTPILFTEIGRSRMNGGSNFIYNQLTSTIKYQTKHPEQILGPCLFMFSDKVWKEGTSEGSFGVYSHGSIKYQIPTIQKDYSYWPGPPCKKYGTLTIDKLIRTSIYSQVTMAYTYN